MNDDTTDDEASPLGWSGNPVFCFGPLPQSPDDCDTDPTSGAESLPSESVRADHAQTGDVGERGGAGGEHVTDLHASDEAALSTLESRETGATLGLLGDTKAQWTVGGRAWQLVLLPTGLCIQAPARTWRTFNAAAAAGLTDSIERFGLCTPLVGYRVVGEDWVNILDGFHRLAMAARLGARWVPVALPVEPLAAADAIEIIFAADRHAVEPTGYDQALLFRYLQLLREEASERVGARSEEESGTKAKGKWTLGRRLADYLGVDRTTGGRKVREIETLALPVVRAWGAGLITTEAAKGLASAPLELQVELLQSLAAADSAATTKSIPLAQDDESDDASSATQTSPNATPPATSPATDPIEPKVPVPVLSPEQREAQRAKAERERIAEWDELRSEVAQALAAGLSLKFIAGRWGCPDPAALKGWIRQGTPPGPEYWAIYVRGALSAGRQHLVYQQALRRMRRLYRLLCSRLTIGAIARQSGVPRSFIKTVLAATAPSANIDWTQAEKFKRWAIQEKQRVVVEGGTMSQRPKAKPRGKGRRLD